MIGDIARDMIEAEARGQDYESYMMDLAAEEEQPKKTKKKTPKRRKR